MNVEEYRRLICNGLQLASQVPYFAVSIGQWRPLVADCHNNVDYWVEKNPDHLAVRGWVTALSDGGNTVILTPHSVVKRPDGLLMDITPLENEYYRKPMKFIPHTDSESEFQRLKAVIGLHLPCTTTGE